MHARHEIIAVSVLVATLGAFAAHATDECVTQTKQPEYSVTTMADVVVLLEQSSGKTWFLRTTSGEPVWVPIRRGNDELPDAVRGQPEQEGPLSTLANQTEYHPFSGRTSGPDGETDTIAQYRSYLYQIEDPTVKGSYRRTSRERENTVLDCAGLLDGVPEEGRVEKERRLAWSTASDELHDHTAVAQLGARLDELARMSRWEDNSSLSNLCTMESALLETKPGMFPHEFESTDGFAEVYRWRAHANYRPKHSGLDVLRDMERYVSMDGDLNEFDMRLVLLAAYYSWRNAIEGETEYAVRIGRALDRILARADAETIHDAMEYLQQAAANGRDDEKKFHALYLMHALTLLRSNPDLATKAKTWLESHHSIYARRLERIEPQLQLLDSLWAIGNR